MKNLKADTAGLAAAVSALEYAKKSIQEADTYWLRHHYTVEICLTASYVFWQPYLNGYTEQYDEGNWSRIWIDQGPTK